MLAVLLLVLGATLAEAAPSWKIERDRARYKARLTPSRFKFPPQAGAWQISHPPNWVVNEDPKSKDTYIFMSANGRIRLLLTRRILNPRIQGSELELEEQNLEVGKALGEKMSTLAASPPKFKEFRNITCRGIYYELTARRAARGEFPNVVGLSVVKDRFHLVGYFQFLEKTEDVALIIRSMIQSISFGDPPS